MVCIIIHPHGDSSHDFNLQKTLILLKNLGFSSKSEKKDKHFGKMTWIRLEKKICY